MRFLSFALFSAAVADPPAKPAVIRTWSSKIDTTAIQSGSVVKQKSTGTAAWQVDGNSTIRTAWVSSTAPFVADFKLGQVYFTDAEQNCQYWCQLTAGEDPCNSQLEGAALCGYDYENKAAYTDTKSFPTGDAYHYHWTDNLAIIPMATRDLYMDAKTGYPVQYVAKFHPFGKWVGTITSDYSEFSTATPAENLFTVGREQYCQMGDPDLQCDSTNILSAMSSVYGAMAQAFVQKQGSPEVVV